ncbi:hypothetical protein L1049_023086 [Liquidambar formosana]|uniref:DUF4283 domain-containing protein n=1 Tax=Liquidambar formosana TaxID=63359 RepID=A0AAP0WST2_LIQFO
MGRDFEELWSRLVLTEDERHSIDIQEEDVRTEKSWQECSLIGRLLTERRYNTEAMKHTLKLVWRPTKGVKILEIGDNLFVFQFFHPLDRRRVIENGPWHFDRFMLIFKEYDGGIQPSDIKLEEVLFWVRFTIRHWIV